MSYHLVKYFLRVIANLEEEIRGSSMSLIYIVGGAVGGALNLIIFLILVTLLIIAKCRIRQKLKLNVDTTLGEFNTSNW